MDSHLLRMKKYVVISYNMNPDYIYYAPLTMWAWAKINWHPVLMWIDSNGMIPFNKLVMDYSPAFTPIRVHEIEGYRTATVAQISRLYAACQLEGLIMTADADMVALSDYWSPNENDKTVYGFDLTGYSEFPICYVSMNSDGWRNVMNLEAGKSLDRFIKRDLDAMPNAKSEDFYKFWGVDQQLITQRLKPFNPTLINRGQYPNGYAVGRMDRSAWNYNHSQFIDMHCFQQLYFKQNQDKFDKTMELLTSIWPDEDFTWFLLYTKEFQKLTGHA